MAGIGLGQRGPSLGANAGIVVTGKLAGTGGLVIHVTKVI
jgi:hypothetical protein